MIALVLGLAQVTPISVTAQESVGSYLAARQATFDYDYEAAAQ